MNVHLAFDAFEMEDEQECGYDFIEVFSGYDDSGPSYGRFCGNSVRENLELYTSLVVVVCGEEYISKVMGGNSVRENSMVETSLVECVREIGKQAELREVLLELGEGKFNVWNITSFVNLVSLISWLNPFMVKFCN